MPVLVTNAGTPLGQLTARALLRGGGEVRAYLDPTRTAGNAAQRLRDAGCKVATGGLDDEGRLELALEQVHTAVHLVAGPLTDPEGEVDDAASLVSAAIGARCRRLVLLSHLGADDPRGNAYLEACAEAEGMAADAPLEAVVVRRALTYGPGDALTATLATGVPPGADGARHAPVLVHDVAGTIAVADLQRGAGRDLFVVIGLAGPDETSLAEVVRHLGAARAVLAAGLAAPPPAPHALPAHTVAVLGRDLGRGEGVLGREGTSLADGVRRLLGEPATGG